MVGEEVFGMVNEKSVATVKGSSLKPIPPNRSAGITR
jgi:hypothetical protein